MIKQVWIVSIVSTVGGQDVDTAYTIDTVHNELLKAEKRKERLVSEGTRSEFIKIDQYGIEVIDNDN